MKKNRSTANNVPTAEDSRASRLKRRLRDINKRGEKELVAIRESIERAKAAFRAQKP